MAALKLGINMAGAISAGAYTAGVLDFLTQALDDWYAAKQRGDTVPIHDVSIEVFAGASAGGMCAAISAFMLYEKFDHIQDVSLKNTNNRFYEGWVNMIDIEQLLKTGDLKSGKPVISLLNSTIIDQIAAFALSPSGAPPVRRPYVADKLTLFLSLTNLRGVPYSLTGVAPGSVEETTFFYGDRIRFETVAGGETSLVTSSAHTLDITRPGAAGGWDVLQTAAMATGAFPVFLAPRVLQRNLEHYNPPLWEPVTAVPKPGDIRPSVPPQNANPYVTLNVDGGVTNNDPFNLAYDYLSTLDPLPPGGQPAQDAVSVDRAVINIAPFPPIEKFNPVFDPGRASGIFSAVTKLFNALISQSRFFGEALSEIMKGATFARFVIAPSDVELAQKYKDAPEEQPAALQCATLGAFGGFFDRDFRAHDYALGRRNCQKFLMEYFVLPANNAVMEPALQALDPAKRDTILARYGRPAPRAYNEQAASQPGSGRRAAEQGAAEVWLPIIPLCSQAVSEPIAPIPRHRMTGAELDRIVRMAAGRFIKLAEVLVGMVKFTPLRWFLRPGPYFIALFGERPVRAALVKGLGESFQG
jgi:predicted acylesterase/phospholipase RssA